MNRSIGVLRIGLALGLAGILGACNPNTPPGPTSVPPLGLLEVSVDTSSQTASAQWVKPLGIQAITVLPINGVTDVQLTRSAVSFYDDLINNTRYVVATFLLTNRTPRNFNNFVLYPVNIVGTTQGGTGVVSMRDATGALITDPAKYRALRPSHGMGAGVGNLVVNPNIADLQWLTPIEAQSVRTQAIAQGLIPNNFLNQPLEYSFVARNLANTRPIAARNTSIACTNDSCKGTITLAYSFPLNPPAPTRFLLYFMAGDESNAYISQSLEEQTQSTVAGLTNTSAFNQTRVLFGSNQTFADNLFPVCQARIAIPFQPGSSDVLVPTLPPATPGSLRACFGASGRRNTLFGADFSQARAIAPTPNGRQFVVAGESFNGDNTDFALARYNLDGTLDTSFGNGGKVTTDFGFDDVANAVAVQADGKVVVAGDAEGAPGTLNSVFALARYNSDGTLDSTFDGTTTMPGFPGNGKVTTELGRSFDAINAMTVVGNEILVAGYTTTSFLPSISRDSILASYDTFGRLNISFDGDGILVPFGGSRDDVATSVAVSISLNRIVVAGYVVSPGGDTDFAVRLLGLNGANTSFGTRITDVDRRSQDQAHSVAFQSDGKVVLGGSSNGNFALLRHNTDGSLDGGFGSGGTVITDFGFDDRINALAVFEERDVIKIVAAGYASNGSNLDFGLARYNENGSLDTTFDTDGKATTAMGPGDDEARAMALFGDIVVAGYSTNSGIRSFAMAAYNNVEETIGPPGGR